jgi:NTE family protein
VDKERVGLVLSGGGARAAYQVGVLTAINRILPKNARNPFEIITGSSAGAINGAAIAASATHFRDGVKKLSYIWSNFSVNQVFRVDVPGITWNSLRWGIALFLGGLGKYNPNALLDRSPLRDLLSQHLVIEDIQRSVDAGALHALGITLSSYASGHSITFFQGVEGLPAWRRARRHGRPAHITLDHLMASSAIPFIFEAQRIHGEYYGDGTMRQIAPVSPALHLGADRLFVIGTQNAPNTMLPKNSTNDYPSIAQIAGHILNSIFLDSLEVDIERLLRINKTLSLIQGQQRDEDGVRLRPVDVLCISPSENLDEIAHRHAHHLPPALKFLLRGIGAYGRKGSSLMSYLLFEKPFCRELIKLGYSDTVRRRGEVLDFLDNARSSRLAG